MKMLSGEEFDRKFDDGEDISDYLDLTTLHKVNSDESRKTNVTMPGWMLDELDGVARHLAISRNAVINVWIGERLDAEREKAGNEHRNAMA